MRRKPYKSNKYFPNNVRAIQDAPDNIFIPVPFNEFINWKVHGYELPDSVYCLIRNKDTETGKIEERYYNTVYHAKKRLSKCIEAGNEITIVSMDGCYHLKPEDIFLDFNND